MSGAGPMPILLHDTLTGSKHALEPLEPGQVGLYACGPTVYDLSHLGHARCYVVWDVVVRHLRARGYRVKYVRNFTDVDDKIIKRANERGEDPVALAARFADAFHQDMDALGCLRPDVEPRVSGHIPEIVALIAALVEKGFAYAPGNGDVYFAVRKFPEYGRLSRRNLDDLLAGARVERRARPSATRSTSRSGRGPSRASRAGPAPGARGGRAGTSSARR